MSRPNYSPNEYQNQYRNPQDSRRSNTVSNTKPRCWRDLPEKYKPTNKPQIFEVKLLYPSSIIGSIIGQEGKSIKDLKKKFTCDIQFIGKDVKLNAKNNNNNHNLLSDRPLKIETKDENGYNARTRIFEVIKEITLKENIKKKTTIGKQTYDETQNMFNKYSRDDQKKSLLF